MSNLRQLHPNVSDVLTELEQARDKLRAPAAFSAKAEVYLR